MRGSSRTDPHTPSAFTCAAPHPAAALRELTTRVKGCSDADRLRRPRQDGANLVRRIARDSDIEVVVYDRDETNVRAIEDHGVAVVTAGDAADENPLVDGLRRLPVHPTTLVIFGATLARRRLLAGDRISLDGAGKAGR